MSLTSGNPPLHDALYALSLAQRVPDAELLDSFIRLYPQYAVELTDFAIDLALDVLNDTASGDADVPLHLKVVTPAVSRAMSRFQNRLYYAGRTAGGGLSASDDSRGGGATTLVNPFAPLSREEFRGLAGRIGATTVFISKLRDRQIEPDTVSDGFVRLVADELHAPLDVVIAHFAAAQTGGSMKGQFYKADEKPNAGGRQSFQDAVRTSGLSEAQQQHLLSL